MRRQSSTSKRVVVRALENVSLTVNHGDQFGIIGHNGAGKSTMLRVFAGIYQPSEGEITIDGRVSPLFSTSPGLDLDDTGYENIVTCGLLLGMSRDEIERKMPEIEAFSELSDYLALPARTYSTGMLVRLASPSRPPSIRKSCCSTRNWAPATRALRRGRPGASRV